MPSAVTYEVPNNGSSLKIIYYAQGNTGGGGAWAEKPFGGRNIAYSGCSVTCLAMVMTYFLNKPITPDKIVDSIQTKYGNYNYFYVSGGQSWDIMPGVANIYGVTCKYISSGSDALNYLKDGNPVIMSCVPGEFTSHGHFIVLTGFYGPYVRVNDPSHPDKSFKNYDPSTIISNGKGWWAFSLENANPGLYTFDPKYSGGGVSEDSNSGEFNLQDLFRYSTVGTVLSLGNDLIQNTDEGSIFINAINSVSKAFNSRLAGNYSTFEITYKTIETEIVTDEIRSVRDYSVEKSGNNLLTYPSLVESPYIILQVGNYKFGTYSKESLNKALHIDYPNYIDQMTVQKVNGQVNQYTITLIYQVQYGDDPNLVDRIFSTVGYGKVKISYGDWASPTFVYKEEEAIITSLNSNVNFGNSSITYTLKCTSDATVLAGGYYSFPAYTSEKPSTIIFGLLEDNMFGIQDVFTGMSNIDKVKQLGLIATDDKPVKIEAQEMDVLSYINYLVTCMTSITNTYESEFEDGVIKDSIYMMSIYDNIFGEEDLNGSYFKIVKINNSTEVLATPDTYVVDVGFPTNTLVMNFNVLNNNSWALLYNYNDQIESPKYIYNIDDEGNVFSKYSPSIAISSKNKEMTETQRTWWTNMTQFPIKAELTLKGLVRPAMLMTYVRINALFYGQRHVSSGLYTVTKQVDTVGKSGYRTTLGLLRIAGDNDYIATTKKKVTSTIPVAVISRQSANIEDTSLLARELDAIGSIFDARIKPTEEQLNNYYQNNGGAFAESMVQDIPKQPSSSGQLVWDILMETINNKFGVAAVMGNLAREGGYKTGIVREKPHSDWKTYTEYYNLYTDITYTQAVDSGKISREEFAHPLINYGEPKKQYGYGICQWTSPGRKEGLYDYAKSLNTSIGDISMQTKYLLMELTSGDRKWKQVFNKLTTTNDIESATEKFCLDFESPNMSDAVASMPERLKQARLAYATYAHSNLEE